ncbi:MAG: hypothetical protein GY832_18790 [Chloroflexi bacterium]|nr:hypothetical protein [Chloroflexota bacterium]
MIFLRYLAEELMGPPTFESASAQWPCPFCESERGFHVLPHKPPHKDRFKCHACGAWGDEWDLLTHLYDQDNLVRRRKRVNQLKAKWKKGAQHSPPVARVAVRPAPADEDWVTESLHDRGVAARKQLEEWITEHYAVDKMGKAQLLEVAAQACRMVVLHGVHPSTLAEDVESYVGFEVREANHMAECDDPDCTWYCCRRARGWSHEQIKEAIEQARRERAND